MFVKIVHLLPLLAALSAPGGAAAAVSLLFTRGAGRDGVRVLLAAGFVDNDLWRSCEDAGDVDETGEGFCDIAPGVLP